MDVAPRTSKKVLTDISIRALKPAAPGARYSVADALVPGLSVRVTDKGGKTFMLVARWNGSKRPAALALGRVGVMTLAAARIKARNWLETRAAGDDPREIERAKRAAQAEQRAATFGLVMEDYFKRVIRLRRHGKRDEQMMRKELVARWGKKPLGEVTRRDVVAVLDAIVDRGAKRQAHLAFSNIRRFYNWAIARDTYGINFSPCDRLRPSLLIGPHVTRTRVLTDPELAAFWHVADRKMGYPFGPLFRLLLLTGQRRSEIGEARWSEIDLDKRLLVIPGERYKTGTAHSVPLSDDAMMLLDGLPRFFGSDYVFNSDGRERGATGYVVAKASLDGHMEVEMGHAPPPFVLHDLRRTVRTRMAGMRVPSEVAEMVLGHARRGIQGVYDRHTYLPEMTEALEAWARKLRTIVEPPPDNVVELRTRGDGKA